MFFIVLQLTTNLMCYKIHSLKRPILKDLIKRDIVNILNTHIFIIHKFK